jgi:hypothetical protein
VTAKVTGAPGQTAGFAAVLGYVDRGNYWYLNIDNEDGGIFKVQNGVTTKVVRLSAPVTVGTLYAVEVRNERNSIKVYLNGAFLGKAKDASVPTGGKFGVGTRGCSAVFDDLLVEVKGLPGTAPAPTAKVTSTPVAPMHKPGTTTQPIPSSTPISLPPGGRRINVSTSAQLSAAMTAARPGDDIVMADGSYTGKTTIGKYGAVCRYSQWHAECPIVLRVLAGRIDGDGLGGPMVCTLEPDTALRFALPSNAAKGFVLDGSPTILWRTFVL